jgi:hypothetical protein
MKLQSAPTFVLALALQLVPIGRVVCVNQAAAPTGFAVVFKWLAAAVTLLGSYHAVSGASAAIAGVANLNPPGPVTLNAAGTVGSAFGYRIIVTNPGVNPQQAFWNAAPLPPGLTINTNIGANGWITGTPTTAGVYPVTLTAGNQNSAIVATKDITITIAGGTGPPTITQQPQSQIVQAGTNVTFTVTASGNSLAYQWLLNSNNVPNATSATLSLANVTPANSGFYSVTVSNGGGSLVSSNAQLLVVPPPGPSVAPAINLVKSGSNQILLSLTTAPGYGYVVQQSTTPVTNSWITLTNLPPAFTGSSISLPQVLSDAPQRYYRAIVTAN